MQYWILALAAGLVDVKGSTSALDKPDGSRLSTQLKVQKGMLAQTQAAADAFKSQVDKAIPNAVKIEKELAEEQAKVSDVEKELAPHTSGEANRDLTKQVTQEKSKLATERASNTQLLSEINATNAQVQDLNSSVDSLKAHIGKVEGTLKAAAAPVHSAVEVELDHVDESMMQPQVVKAGPTKKAADEEFDPLSSNAVFALGLCFALHAA